MNTEGSEDDSVIVGMVADPDLPARLAHELSTALPDLLARRVRDVDWQVEVVYDPFEAMYPDDEHLIDKAAQHVRDTDWDLALCLTDLPMRAADGVVLASLDERHHVALISLPALGGWRLRHRLQELAVRTVDALRPREGRAPDRELRLPRPFHRATLDANDDIARVLLGRVTGMPRLLAGMVRANRPWQLFLGLSSALAGALAGTAFGVLYSTIWQLATALEPVRLAGVVVTAVAALMIWTIAGHGLWERDDPTGMAKGHDLTLRNAGTIATVAVGTIVFFAALFLLTCAAVGLIIPPTYLASVLGRSVGVGDYLTIAAMASALGTVAGAVGSGLEDDTTVRRATYGYRERERRDRVARDRDR
ncbi:hypothetical protein [Nocardia cyriacigeorgica]|uniref:hypothetical protein n=1 Tax=Nocardia cyriacigeorgica TaxID=135487 RepID=UPI000CE9D7AC|nr:hypothetical protein [Nocardia cyriacigeorgica]AVH23534.1 hypothetical protein C5B73_20990 [Nocardia cyriacigeorgica]MBF6323121.1 hypothetical protein [Nocardia cyriacigeorgica]PPJ15564.1 hypothetical protein C5E43_05155 [Nocardia cyriacigeorgica]